jgi:hypothetical protein
MPETNSRLKAIVHDAKLTCRDKLKEASETLENGEEKIIPLIDDVKAVFRKFDDIAIWTKPLPFDEPHLLGQIILLNEAPADDLNELTTTLEAFLEAFEQVTIVVEVRDINPANDTTDPWNVRALNALRKTRVQIEAKKEWLQASGHDPSQVDGFEEEEQQLGRLLKIYRHALIKNEVQAHQTDIVLFNKFEEIFRIVEELDKFVLYHKAYTKSIRKRCPQPAEA